MDMTGKWVPYFIRALAIQAEIEGMKAHDKHKELTGNTTLYTEESYDKKADELYGLASELEGVMRGAHR